MVDVPWQSSVTSRSPTSTYAAPPSEAEPASRPPPDSSTMPPLVEPPMNTLPPRAALEKRTKARQRISDRPPFRTSMPPPSPGVVPLSTYTSCVAPSEEPARVAAAPSRWIDPPPRSAELSWNLTLDAVGAVDVSVMLTVESNVEDTAPPCPSAWLPQNAVQRPAKSGEVATPSSPWLSTAPPSPVVSPPVSETNCRSRRAPAATSNRRSPRPDASTRVVVVPSTTLPRSCNVVPAARSRSPSAAPPGPPTLRAAIVTAGSKVTTVVPPAATASWTAARSVQVPVAVAHTPSIDRSTPSRGSSTTNGPAAAAEPTGTTTAATAVHTAARVSAADRTRRRGLDSPIWPPSADGARCLTFQAARVLPIQDS